MSFQQAYMQYSGLSSLGAADRAAIGAFEYLPLASSLGPEIAEAAVASGPALAIGAAGLAGAYGIGKYIKGRIDSNKSQKDKMMVGYVGSKRNRDGGIKTTRIGDPASYRQLSSTKRRYGRKVRAVTRHLKLLKTVTDPLRFRYGRASDISASTGQYWLTQQAITDGTTTYTALPIYIISLNATTNGLENTSKAGYKMFELARGSTGHLFRAVNGVHPFTAGTSTAIDTPVFPTPSPNYVGRRGMLDWTRIKFCFWGKSKNPSNIRIRLVRFMDEEFCPEFYYPRGSVTSGTTATSVWSSQMTPKASEYWGAQEKYLLNGHMAYSGRADRKRYVKVIKQYILNLNPIDAGAETANSDARPHMKHFDLFNRWNRICDFTDTNLNLNQTLSATRDVNFLGSPFDAFNGTLKNMEKGLYYIIDSVEPRESSVAAATDNPRKAPDDTSLSVSFDMTLDTQYTTLERRVLPDP